jgi:hypothetical protein
VQTLGIGFIDVAVFERHLKPGNDAQGQFKQKEIPRPSRGEELKDNLQENVNDSADRSDRRLAVRRPADHLDVRAVAAVDQASAVRRHLAADRLVDRLAAGHPGPGLDLS